MVKFSYLPSTQFDVPVVFYYIQYKTGVTRMLGAWKEEIWTWADNIYTTKGDMLGVECTESHVLSTIIRGCNTRGVPAEGDNSEVGVLRSKPWMQSPNHPMGCPTGDDLDGSLRELNESLNLQGVK